MKKKPAKILIIEDEEVMQETLKSILKKKYETKAAENGFKGLEEIKTGSYSL